MVKTTNLEISSLERRSLKICSLGGITQACDAMAFSWSKIYFVARCEEQLTQQQKKTETLFF